MPTEAAQILFRRIQRDERGVVPEFALDQGRQNTNVEGVVARDAKGQPVLTQGFKVLLLIQNGAGRRLEVAELS